MCQACNTKNSVQVYARQQKADPSKTLPLQNAMVRELNRRFSNIERLIVDAVVKNDVFGLTLQTNAAPPKHAFSFPRSADKVQAFMDWLKQTIDEELVKVGTTPQLGTGVEAAWTNLYIEDSYKRGVQRARVEMKHAGMQDILTVAESGGIDAVMATPFHADRVGVLYSRTYEELQGVSTQMGSQISRVLSQGMIDGDNPRLLARKMLAVISGAGGDLGLTDVLGRFIPARRRAEIIARTEIVRAHHVATIQEYRNWGVSGISVQAEWVTAGDSRVCSKCAELQGRIYTLDEIESMIPAHPQCRCVAIPTLPEQAQETQPIEATWAPSDNLAYLNNPESGWEIIGDADKILEYSGLNLKQLDADLAQILPDYAKKTITLFRDGSFQVKYTHEGWKRYNLQRTFSNKRVSHDYFKLPEDDQGKGTSKNVLSVFYKQYRQMGLEKIDIHANIDVGGYAWGRYGFSIPKSALRLETLGDTHSGLFVTGGKYEKKLLRDLTNEYFANNPTSTSLPMNVIANHPEGKNILLGSDWEGFMDLTNPVQRQLFEDYLKYKK